MATVNDLVTSALRRLRIVALGQTPRADYASHALTAFNDMLYSWQGHGVYLLMPADFALSDTFVIFVPPAEWEWSDINQSEYKGTWDANANSPALTTITSERGDVYKVTTAGSTTLDDVTSWAVNDYAAYDGTTWRKGISSRRLENGIHAMLAERIAVDYGRALNDVTLRDAREGWADVCAAFIRPQTRDVHDSAIVRAPSNRYQDYISGEG
jgi:hypothetical protein